MYFSNPENIEMNVCENDYILMNFSDFIREWHAAVIKFPEFYASKVAWKITAELRK